MMTVRPQVLYTAEATVQGGRAGTASSASGRLSVELSRPADPSGTGTNPEELFAAGYAACFDSAVAVAARRLGVRTGSTRTTAAVDLVEDADGRYGLRVRLVVRAPDCAPAEFKEVVDLADGLCPYSNAVRGNVAVRIVVDGE
jgi:lipoyl-dependent peroxiredoxin